MTRRMQYRGDMQAEWSSYGPDTAAIATAFVRGVNAWVDIALKHPAEEFARRSKLRNDHVAEVLLMFAIPEDFARDDESHTGELRRIDRVVKTFLFTDPSEGEHVIIVTITWSKQIEVDAVRDHRIASRRRTALRFGNADELRIGIRENRLRIQRRCEMQRRDARRRRVRVVRSEVEAVIVHDIDVADHFRNELAQSPPRRGARIRIESSTLTRCGDQIAAHRRPVARNHDRVVTGSDDRIIDQ